MNKSLLRADGINVDFSGIAALSNASIEVGVGEVVAVIGPNGAGKTTLLNVLSGVVSPSSGSIELAGKQIQGLSPHLIAQLGVRRTFQNGGLFGQLSVVENVLVGLHRTIESSFSGLFFGSASARDAERRATAQALALLERMGMGSFAEARTSSLSGGQQRIVELVRTMAAKPRLLLLDEPAVGLSPAARDQLSAIVRGLARDDGVGVIFIEHAMDMVMELADRIVVFNSGTKLADGHPEEVRRDPLVLEAYLGRE